MPAQEPEPRQKHRKKRKGKFDQFEGEDKNSLLQLEKEHEKKGYVVVGRKGMKEPIEGIPHFDTVLVGLLNGKPTFAFIKRKDIGRIPPKFRADSERKQGNRPEGTPARQREKVKKPTERRKKEPPVRTSRTDRSQKKVQERKKEKSPKKPAPKPSKKRATKVPTKKPTKSKAQAGRNRTLFDYL
jgi:flagellar biosynthesis GTPase FlhF